MNILRKREKGTVGTEKPPPLVRTCNGIIAGLGYLEVGFDFHNPPWAVKCIGAGYSAIQRPSK